MSIRRAPQYSDRGSIKDRAEAIANGEDLKLTSSELRMQKLINFADFHKDTALLDAMGFITTSYISDKNAMPLSIYRIRQIVSDIKKKSSQDINRLCEQFSNILNKGPAYSEMDRNKIKKAAHLKKPVFWRVSK